MELKYCLAEIMVSFELVSSCVMLAHVANDFSALVLAY